MASAGVADVHYHFNMSASYIDQIEVANIHINKIAVVNPKKKKYFFPIYLLLNAHVHFSVSPKLS